MADLKKTGKALTSVIGKASKQADDIIAANKAMNEEGKLAEALKAKQAPMTTPKTAGAPFLPRQHGMYPPDVKQENLPRQQGRGGKYTERMQDLLDSPTARKKVDKLINQGKDLNMTEWYGTEPLRQAALDVISPEQYASFMAQLASASQRNPVDKQNQMGSYLWYLANQGKLTDDSYLLTNKIRSGKAKAPEGSAVEFPAGYGSLAQGDIFSRGKQIASGDIEGALPPDKKLGTFYRNLMGNLEPVTVDVNAVRGPVIERGDPRWLASKVVDKDEEGNILGTHFPRKDVESGKMSMKEAKARPGFWEAAPKGSEYAGFEELWQRGAKRHDVRPAEAQALGWYGSADVTALKTKPELYVDNLERLIERTAEQTGKSRSQVLNDVLKGKDFLRKDGGAIHRAKGGATNRSDYQARLDAMMEKHMADGGGAFKKVQFKADGGTIDNTIPDDSDGGAVMFAPKYASGGSIHHGVKPFPWKAAGGGWAKAGKAIAKAAQEAGAMKAPQTAEKDLTTLQDFHTSLGDSVRARALEAQRQMESFDYKYDKGQRVFTKDSAAKNKPPYTIIGRTRVGNVPMREDMSDLRSKKVIDPETGKTKRTPYEPGYKVRYENGDDWSEFDIPASAIVGDVEMRNGGMAHFDGGGMAIDQSGLGDAEPSKTKLMAEILARMAKEQGKEEIASLKKPRAITDLLNRGVVASTVGAPVDLINMGLEGVDAVRGLVSGKPVENRLASDKPVGGSEQLKDLMNRYNMTSGEERPIMETALSFASPAGALKGVSSAGKATPKVEGALNKISNLELNKSGKLSNPATTASEATVGTTQGAKYATKQEGPFLRVRQTAADSSKGSDRGTREASGLSSQGAGAGGTGEAGVRLPQRYSPEEVDRLVKDPNLNEPLQVAQRYTKENLGTDFVAPDIPESSLAKQSAIARTHELALSDDPAYKGAVFDAYAREMPEVLEQAGAKNYDDLMEKAYRQLAKETDAQFQALPFNFSYHRGGEGNYSGTREMLEDVHGNKHMYVFQGGDPHDFLNRVDDVTGLNENEKFRAVHDAMGHAIYGNEFGPLGEEKAWAIHQQMYSPLARLAMTAETRGQNSLVNYSPLNVNLKDEVAKLRELQIESRRRGDKEGERIATEAIRDAFSGFQFAPQKAILLPPEFVNPKYTGGMPDYIQPMITPAAGTTTKSALTHFSHNPDLKMTDPSKYGTGIKGAEKARLENTNNPLIPRTYFYAGEPGAVAPEGGLGVNRYRSESESLYDITKDPLRLKALARESNRTPFTAKYNAGIRSPEQELTDVERMIREYGYEGYINPATTKPAAVVYTPKQVERRRKGGLAMVKA